MRGISEIGASNPANSRLAESYTVAPHPMREGKSFEKVLEGIKGPPAKIDFDLHGEILTLQHSIFRGKELTPRDLLLYQIRVGQFNLGVELYSKLAESASATVRRFEQGQ